MRLKAVVGEKKSLEPKAGQLILLIDWTKTDI